MNYLKVVPEGEDYRFERDIQLGFDPRLHPNVGRFSIKHKFIPPDEVVQSGKLIPIDPVNISDIPPTLFLVACNNVYSRGFDLFVPTDMSLDVFSQEMAQHIFEHRKLSLICGRKYVNFEELDSGYVDTVQWNQKAHQRNAIWVTETSLVSSAQSVIKIARILHQQTK